MLLQLASPWHVSIPCTWDVTASVSARGTWPRATPRLSITQSRALPRQQRLIAQEGAAGCLLYAWQRNRFFHRRVPRNGQAVTLQQPAKRSGIVSRFAKIVMLFSQLLLSLFVCRLFLLPSHQQTHWLTLHPLGQLARIVLTVLWFIVLPNSSLFGSLNLAIRRSIMLIGNRAQPWVPKWYLEHVGSALSTLVEHVSAGSMRFIALCIVVTATPPSWQLPMNEHLRFLDANGDGIIQADEIEDWILEVLKRLFVAFRALDLGHFFLEIKKFPMKDLLEKELLADTSSKPRLHTFIVGFFREKYRLGPTDKSTGILILLDGMLTAIIYTAMLMPWLKVLGLRVQTIFALGGVGGLAVGLASQNLVANGIATILIHLQRRFTEGQEVESRGKNIRGVVEKIGLLSTVVNQLDGMPIRVPNSVLLADALVIRSTKHFRGFEEKLHVILDDMNNMSDMLQKAGDALADHPEVLSTQEVQALKAQLKGSLKLYPPIACYGGVSERGLVIYVRAYARGSMSNDAFRRMKSEILMRVNDVILEFGGSFAFRTLSPWCSHQDDRKQ